MKNIYLFFTFLIVAACITHAQDIKKPVHNTPIKNKKKLEDKVRQYFFVMLTKGANRDHDSVTTANIQAGHIANIINYITKAN